MSRAFPHERDESSPPTAWPRSSASPIRIESGDRRAIRTERIGDEALWVWPVLVNDAKTPQRWQREMRAAVDPMSALNTGQPVEPVWWRRRWTDITSTR
jgi:hypothetical protein